MPDEKKSADAQAPSSGRVSLQTPQPRSEEEARVWAILDRALKETKTKRKEQLEAEVIGSDILNLRLKSSARH